MDNVFTKSKIQMISEVAEIKQSLLNTINKYTDHYDVRNMYVNILGESVSPTNFMAGQKRTSKTFDNVIKAIDFMESNDILYITQNDEKEHIFCILRSI